MNIIRNVCVQVHSVNPIRFAILPQIRRIIHKQLLAEFERLVSLPDEDAIDGDIQFVDERVKITSTHPSISSL